MRILADAGVRRWLAVALLLLVPAGGVQRYVEDRRVAANLTWADPEKNALEVGFLALGGFRGILADILWIRAIRHQDSARYYELKLICDMILRLQPTFTHVHAFQAYNMSYNLAFKATNNEDKWYWIRAGITTLEKGLERNYRNYSLWFELGYQYFDRLGDTKMEGYQEIRVRELPNIDDLTDTERKAVFLHEAERKARWARTGFRPSPARVDEHLRFAAYYFWQAMETNTDPVPLRTERVFGDCIEKLGHWRAKYPLEKLRELMSKHECRWDDWGSEDWWVEVRRRNAERGESDTTVPTNLKFCLYQQMDYYMLQAADAAKKGQPDVAAKLEKRARDAHSRFQSYFPDEHKTMEQLLETYRAYRHAQREGRDKAAGIMPAGH
ncbi:MAG: hypothetical protein NTW87_18640 [Planctomycetota bacterium]|nr:hypothetical protein [Planctomycetota bacterium]